MSNNPATRMAAFDAMPPEERSLANEYGVNVVALYRSMGATDEQLRYACERHRANRQREAFYSADYAVRGALITRSGVQGGVAKIMQNNLLREHDSRIQAESQVAADKIIEASLKHEETHPLPEPAQKTGWVSHFFAMLGR